MSVAPITYPQLVSGFLPGSTLVPACPVPVVVDCACVPSLSPAAIAEYPDLEAPRASFLRTSTPPGRARNDDLLRMKEWRNSREHQDPGHESRGAWHAGKITGVAWKSGKMPQIWEKLSGLR